LGTNPVPSGHAIWRRQFAVRAELPQHFVTETGLVVWGENERRLGGVAGQGILGAREPPSQFSKIRFLIPKVGR
jgi:hypothetical protein